MTLPSLAIVVLERGFVYVGNIHLSDGFLTITGAQNIRKWGTTAGLGELAQLGPRPESKLDPCPDVFVPVHALIYLIQCVPEKWTSHAR